MSNVRIKCEVCGSEVHAIMVHLKESHPDWTIERYQSAYPTAPMFSELGKEALRKQQAAAALKKAEQASAASLGVAAIPLSVAKTTMRVDKRAMHEVFELGAVPGALNGQGKPIAITVMTGGDQLDMVPAIDKAFVFEVETLKNALLAMELNKAMLFWGFHGTGKTMLARQLAARTGRPLVRIQHTINTEESHMLGQWTVRAGETRFELGPLPLAMKHGWVYLADEYDRALPSVLSVYQPVLEGEPLYIKEADAANRLIKPHENFRFIATGNTNGGGDETGLYQSTVIQDASNYDRFGVTLQINYMPKILERQILIQKTKIHPDDADKLVDFAGRIREAHAGRKISTTVSPRTLLNAAQLGILRSDFRIGIALAFGNKLNNVDREVVDQVSQRIFGENKS